jgi:sugar/nucleoside kinase (ribokinase family)
MEKTFNVVAAGRAYTDIIAHVSVEFLRQHQIPLDGQRECAVTELTQLQHELKLSQIVPGGPGANTVAIIAALGGTAGYFGKVYHDNAGQTFLADFTARNVVMCCASNATTPAMSATCLVLLTDQHRSFAYNPGCADYFSAADFNSFDFATTDFFLIEAHLLTSIIANNAIKTAMELALNKTSIVINLQGITEWKNFHDEARQIASHANIVIGNQQEQLAFAYVVNSLRLPTPLSQLIVTTKGANGAVVASLGRQLYHHAPATKPVKLVSSNGAGDAFIAGLLLAQSRGLSIEDSMDRAILTATAILEDTGARPTRPLTLL